MQIVVGRPGEVADFGTGSPEMMTAHEMTHFMPKATAKPRQATVLSDEAAIALTNRIRAELSMDWSRVLDHSKEEFINRETGKKVSVDAHGNMSVSDATDEEVKALTPSKETEKEVGREREE